MTTTTPGLNKDEPKQITPLTELKPLPQSQAPDKAQSTLIKRNASQSPQHPIYPESPSINQLLDQNHNLFKDQSQKYSIPGELVLNKDRLLTYATPKITPGELISMTVIIMLNLLTTRNSTMRAQHHSTDSQSKKENVTLTRFTHHLLT